MRWKLILGGAAVAVVAAAALAYFWTFGGDRGVLRLPGVVEIQEVHVASKIGGRVADIKCYEGQRVEAGQELVVFEVPELKAQRDQMQARLNAAVADLDKANAGPRLEEKEAARRAAEAAKAKWELVKAGPRAEEVRQGRVELDVAQTDLKLAQEDYQRAERLVGTAAMTRADFDAYRAALERARGRVATSRAKLDILEAGSRPEEKEQAQAEYRQAEANWQLLKAGTRSEDIAAAEARVAEARGKLAEMDANLAEAVVRAPEPAVVDVLAVRKGDVLPANGPVARLLRAGDVWVRVYVPETDLGKVRLNQEVQVTNDSYPGRRFSGHVIHIAAESEFTPRNVQSADERHHQVFGVKVRVEDPEGVFKAGMAAEVAVPLQ
jgi:multidrug resistance efflux pump